MDSAADGMSGTDSQQPQMQELGGSSGPLQLRADQAGRNPLGKTKMKTTAASHVLTSKEVESDADSAEGHRFEFGENWSRFLTRLTDERIVAAETSLQQMLEVTSVAGTGLLDIGYGSEAPWGS